MITRLSVTIAMLLPISSLAADVSNGEEIFSRKCQTCHTQSRVTKLLDPAKEENTNAYLSRFLRSHPASLDDGEKDLVIEMLLQNAM
jgi:hypothetical protein